MTADIVFSAIDRFNDLIDRIEARCLAVDGPVTPTLQEMREDELSSIWQNPQTIRASLSPAATPVSEAGGGGPTYVVNCCNCGRIVDTREKDAGGDGFGAELADEERWVCSPECWDAVVEPDLGKPASSPAGGVREAATAFDKLVGYGVRRSDRHGTGTLFLLAGGHSFFLSDIDRDAIRSSLSQSTSAGRVGE